MKPPIVPLMHIVWRDHAQFSETRWRRPEEALELAKNSTIHSVGWLIHQDKLQYILAAVLDDESNSRSEITIFKNCVIRKRVIK